MSVAMVTGGRGFAGSWLAKALLERGDTVVSFDRPRADDRPTTQRLIGIADGVIAVEGDVRDPEAIGRALAAHRVEVVFHLAAEAIVADVRASPVSAFEANVRGTWNLLEASRAAGVARVVCASSDKAYGAHETLPYREQAALAPTAPYEASKAAADLIARSYWHAYGLPVAVTRFANLYGGGDLHRSRLVPAAIAATLAGRAPVLRSDGSPQRDFLYVEDAADAYLAIADGLDRDEVRGEAFNAGAGRAYPVGEVVELIVRLAGDGPAPQFAGSGTPEGDIDRQCVDPGKVRRLLGWTPRVGLEQGLGRAIEWYRANPAALAALA